MTSKGRTGSTVYPYGNGGHAKGHLRDAFTMMAEGDGPEWQLLQHDGLPLTEQRLIDLLWNCTDIMPGNLCDELQLPRGSNYARAAHEMCASMAEAGAWSCE
jgi:hypothetical protein